MFADEFSGCFEDNLSLHICGHNVQAFLEDQLLLIQTANGFIIGVRIFEGHYIIRPRVDQ